MKTREEAREYERKWYSTPEGKAKRLAINARRRERLKQAFMELKSTLHCVECGESHPATLDFHHVDPKTKVKGVSQMVKDASLERVKQEIEKCIVLCANCHRKLHYTE